MDDIGCKKGKSFVAILICISTIFNSRPCRSKASASGPNRRNTGAAEYSPSQEAVRRQHPKYSFADNVQAMMAMYQGYRMWVMVGQPEMGEYHGIPSGNLLQFAIENGH